MIEVVLPMFRQCAIVSQGCDPRFRPRVVAFMTIKVNGDPFMFIDVEDQFLRDPICVYATKEYTENKEFATFQRNKRPYDYDHKEQRSKARAISTQRSPSLSGNSDHQ